MAEAALGDVNAEFHDYSAVSRIQLDARGIVGAQEEVFAWRVWQWVFTASTFDDTPQVRGDPRRIAEEMFSAAAELAPAAQPSLPPITFLITVDPPAPRLGDRVQVTVDASGFGGLVKYDLRVNSQYLTPVVKNHDPLTRYASSFGNPVSWDLLATTVGTVRLSVSANYETVRYRLDGHYWFHFTTSSSDPITITIGPPSPSSTSTESGSEASDTSLVKELIAECDIKMEAQIAVEAILAVTVYSNATPTVRCDGPNFVSVTKVGADLIKGASIQRFAHADVALRALGEPNAEFSGYLAVAGVERDSMGRGTKRLAWADGRRLFSAWVSEQTPSAAAGLPGAEEVADALDLRYQLALYLGIFESD